MPQPPKRSTGSKPAGQAKPARAAGPSTPPPAQGQSAPGGGKPKFAVDLPAGGRLALQDADEVRMWEDSAKRYVQDYGLVKANDLMLLGAILSQGIAMFRAQQQLSDPKKAPQAVTLIGKASEQIRELEKALGIDKKTREAGGQHTVTDYVTRLKRAAHAKGVHISERVLRFEAFNNELRWRLRLLENGDDEDKAYHGISDATVLQFARDGLAEIEEFDKKWAHAQGVVFVGKL